MWNDGGRTPQLNGPNRHNATLFLTKTCVRNLSSKETRQYGNASKLPVALDDDDDDDGFLLCNQKTVKFQLGLNGILVHAEHLLQTTATDPTRWEAYKTAKNTSSGLWYSVGLGLRYRLRRTVHNSIDKSNTVHISFRGFYTEKIYSIQEWKGQLFIG